LTIDRYDVPHQAQVNGVVDRRCDAKRSALLGAVAGWLSSWFGIVPPVIAG
jgi:hypothetical protein